MRFLVAALVLTLARGAFADEVDDLVTTGEALAKTGEWSRAIDAFKAADAKRPRAKHACLIGLAYTRKEAWAEAELFFSICKQRATGGDAAPDWLADAETTLAQKLAGANAAPVTLVVTPREAIPLVTVSSFAPGESFSPRTIHLAPGTHVIEVTAPGYRAAKVEVQITSNAAKTVDVVLESLAPRRAPSSKVPLVLWIAGGALLAGGVAYDELELQPLLGKLQPLQSDYNDHQGEARRAQQITIGLFAVGAATVVTGLVLHYTIYRHKEAPRVGALYVRGGGGLTLEWTR